MSTRVESIETSCQRASTAAGAWKTRSPPRLNCAPRGGDLYGSDDLACRGHGGESRGWTRALAILIDAIGIGILAGAVTSILGRDPASIQYQGLTTLFQAAYFTYFWSAAGKGQTLGSRALNIRVVKTDGSYLDYPGAFLRYIGFVISIVVIFIGVIWAAFDAQRQGWHDKIAGTYVVKA